MKIGLKVFFNIYIDCQLILLLGHHHSPPPPESVEKSAPELGGTYFGGRVSQSNLY